jgi:hypothetical protein
MCCGSKTQNLKIKRGPEKWRDVATELIFYKSAAATKGNLD